MLDSGVIPVVAAPRSRNSGLKRVASGSGLGVCKQGGLSRLSILGPRGGLMGYGFWSRLDLCCASLLNRLASYGRR